MRPVPCVTSLQLARGELLTFFGLGRHGEAHAKEVGEIAIGGIALLTSHQRLDLDQYGVVISKGLPKARQQRCLARASRAKK